MLMGSLTRARNSPAVCLSPRSHFARGAQINSDLAGEILLGRTERLAMVDKGFTSRGYTNFVITP